MTPVRIKDLKNGDTFFECDLGFTDQYVATSDPYQGREATTQHCICIDVRCVKTGREDYFCESDTYELNLYK